MRGVTIRKQVTLTMTADDWSLYDSLPLVEHAADLINQAIEQAFNRGESLHDVRVAAEKVMGEWADYGATDTEPLEILGRLLEELYGPPPRPGANARLFGSRW